MAQALRAGFLFLPQVCWGKLVGFCSCQERNSRATHVAPQAVCAKYELHVSQEGESESGSQPVLGSHLGASTRAMPGWPRALPSDGFELSSLSGRSQVVLLIELEGAPESPGGRLVRHGVWAASPALRRGVSHVSQGPRGGRSRGVALSAGSKSRAAQSETQRGQRSEEQGWHVTVLEGDVRWP